MVSFSKMAVQPFVIASVLFTSALGAPFYGKVIGRDTTLAASYDFIVVGGGPSGLVVANRLSESSNVTVLVIEAGELDQREAAIQIPGNVAYGTGVVGTKYDWNLTYTAQTDADDREISIPLGKVVGGGTVLNRMLFDRGSAADYDRWATLGNDGWDWAGLLPYFIKSETWTPPSADLIAEFGITSDSSVHGTDGYLQSSYPPFSWPSTSNFFESVNSLGINVPNDGASGEALGAFWTTLALDPTTVTRCSARDAYYDTVSSRSNLHLLTGNQVTKLITNTTACGDIEILGVQYATDSTAAIQNITANTEVILAAGSIHTPQLLQLSGIGDSGLLSELGISTLIDLPGVGSNFQDHAYVAVAHSLNIAEYSGNITSNATYAAEMLALYETNLTGPYTTAGTNSLMFMPFANISNTSSTLSSTVSSESASTYLPTNISATVLAGYEAQYKLLTDGLTATDIAVMEFIYNDGTIIPALQHPFSRGTVKINSTSAFDAPVADPRYLSNPNDLAIMVEAIKFARTIVATDAFAPLSPVELAPGAAVTSDADLESYVRSSFTTIYHPSGTASMLPLADGGVVDSALLVYGTSNLRIVDASVFPMLPATHIMSTVYAVAEKSADAIKSANGL